MYSSFIRNIIISVLSIYILTGCSTGVGGEFIIGRPGSPAWFGMASQETVISHYKKACKSYGFPDGSIEMAGCVQKAISSGRDLSETRKMNSLKILDDMGRRERESRQTPQNKSITCYQQGYYTHCN
jgi:hypothetical protein